MFLSESILKITSFFLSDGKLEVVVPSFVHYLEVLEGSDGDKVPGKTCIFELAVRLRQTGLTGYNKLNKHVNTNYKYAYNFS